MTLSESLALWYAENARVLPFRSDPTPYHVLLSETMLQQTQVKTVLPYYRRFLAVYPTIGALSQADEQSVLKLWEGLGYYSRARNLLSAAKTIQADCDGKIPMDYASLSKLKGVGPYIAHAVMAIAFHEKAVAVDGNLIRVYARLTMDADVKTSPAMKARAEAYLLAHMGTMDPADFNPALMDLGEMVCLPHGTPLCESCPFRAFCLAHAKRRETDFPVALPRKEKPVETKTLLVFVKNGTIGILKREESLLHGLYGFPMTEGRLSTAAIQKRYPGAKVWPLGTHTHGFSHRIWQMEGYAIEAMPEGLGLIYLPSGTIVKDYPLATPFRVFLKRAITKADQ